VPSLNAGTLPPVSLITNIIIPGVEAVGKVATVYDGNVKFVGAAAWVVAIVPRSYVAVTVVNKLPSSSE
jgi:hypothetical protein